MCLKRVIIFYDIYQLRAQNANRRKLTIGLTMSEISALVNRPHNIYIVHKNYNFFLVILPLIIRELLRQLLVRAHLCVYAVLGSRHCIRIGHIIYLEFYTPYIGRDTHFVRRPLLNFDKNAYATDHIIIIISESNYSPRKLEYTRHTVPRALRLL